MFLAANLLIIANTFNGVKTFARNCPHSLITIPGQVIISHLLRRNKTLMFLLVDNDSLFTCFKHEKRNQIVFHKLCSYGTANKLRKFYGA